MPPPFSDGDTMGKTLVVSGQQHRRSFAPCRKKQMFYWVTTGRILLLSTASSASRM